MEAPLRYTTEDLLAEAGWLASLARRLVSDAAGADDLVQDTWVAALRRPPERARPLRPWLARVARNVARMRRRGEASRAVRERSRPVERELATPDELAARLEGQRRLADALARLAEPYRSTILLAYFERRSSEEIARELGIAAGTVRWRAKRGIEALRRELDERHGGDRAAWALSLAPLARAPEPELAWTPAAALPWQGAWLVSTWLKVCAATAAVALVATVLALSGAVPSPWASGGAPAVVPVTFAPIAERAAAPANPSDVERQPVGAAGEPVERGATPATVPTAVEARLLDRDGRPIVEGELAEVFGTGRRASRADPGGRVRLELRSAGLLRVRATALGFASRELAFAVEDGATASLGDVVLDPGGDVTGRVVDSEGTPVALAIVLPSDLDRPAPEIEPMRWTPVYAHGPCYAFSDREGRFHLRGAQAGLVRLAAWKDGYLTTFSGSIEVRSGQESAGVDIVLERVPEDRRIEGRVVDPSGAPVASAWVAHESGGGSESTHADLDGRFRFAALAAGPHSIVARDPEQRFALAAVGGVERGTTGIVLALTERAPIDVAVRTRDGRAVERFVASALHPELGARFGESMAARTSDGPHAEGRARLSSPSARYVVEIDAPGFEIGRAGPFEGPEPRAVEIVLEPMPGVRGVVLAGGRPVAGARVTVFAHDDNRYERDGFAVRWNPDPVANAASDANGEFLVTLRERGSYVLRVEADGFAPCEIGPLQLDPRTGASGLVARLGSGGAIEGTVRVAAGRSPLGTVVAFSSGDGFAFTRRVGTDGAFRVERLAPGRWLVTAVDEEIAAGGARLTTWSGGARGEIPWNCEVVEGETTRFDLDVAGSPPRDVELAGSLTVDGAAPGPWTVTLLPARRDPSGSRFAEAEKLGSLDPDGRFHARVGAAGDALLLLVSLEGPLASLRIAAPISLSEGANAWRLDLATAQVRVECAPWGEDGERALGVVWVGPNGAFAVLPLESAPTQALNAPAGRLMLVRFGDVDPGLPAARWPALAEATVAPGASATLRAP